MSSTIVGTPGVTSTATSASAAMKQEIGMNKDDFLKLFIAQLQNQDPLSPQDPTEMLGQLAQLTQVEQAYNTNTALNNLIAAQNSSIAMSAVSLIGGSITASGNQVNFDGINSSTVKFSLPIATTGTTLTISNAAGQLVRTVNLGEQAAGTGAYQWDGKDGQGNQLAAGEYTFAVNGTDANGRSQTATTYTTGVVSGIDLSSGSAMLKIGSVSVPLGNVLSVSSS